MKTLSIYRPCAIAVLVMAAAVPAVAQTNKSLEPRKDASDAAFTTQLVKTGLYSISGGGSNSLLRLSQNGLIVVDGKPAGNYDLLLARIKKISDQPIRVVILTDHHDTHTGSDARFLADGAGIIVQENARRNLGTSISDSIDGTAPLRIVTYDREYKVRMGGVEAQLLHFGNAYTNGDTVVYFPNLKVVAVGDLFAATPDPDFFGWRKPGGLGTCAGRDSKVGLRRGNSRNGFFDYQNGSRSSQKQNRHTGVPCHPISQSACFQGSIDGRTQDRRSGLAV